MPGRYERHLAAQQDTRDLGEWTCQGQQAIDDDDLAAPDDVTGGHVCRWITVAIDEDDARDLAIDDDLLDAP